MHHAHKQQKPPPADDDIWKLPYRLRIRETLARSRYQKTALEASKRLARENSNILAFVQK